MVALGAGPAGLAAAYDLSVRHGVKCLMVERKACAGGLCETIERGGFRFDIGPHRFFTKNTRVEALWSEVLGDDFIERPRKTRIHYEDVFFDYPLKPFDVAWKLGLIRSAGAALSYFKRHLFPLSPEDGFENWVRNRFGDTLYEIFFEGYTRKVWGVDPSSIDAEWAAQRIRALSLGKMLWQIVSPSPKHASLVSKFHYPRLGAGMMYETMARKIEESGSRILLEREVSGLELDGDGCVEAVSFSSPEGGNKRVEVGKEGWVVSSVPLDCLARFLAEAGDFPGLAEAASNLRYRSLVTVEVAASKRPPVDDNWIYLNSDDVRAGRMSLFHNWSPEMVPSPDAASICLEYFVDEGDEIWNASDERLFSMAMDDLSKLGFAKDVPDDSQFAVVRYSKAYPCYFGEYKKNLAAIRKAVDSVPNLIPVGRYGQFRYNNMDHSVETGLIAAEMVMGAERDPWAVNEDAEYHEEKK